MTTKYIMRKDQALNIVLKRLNYVLGFLIISLVKTNRKLKKKINIIICNGIATRSIDVKMLNTVNVGIFIYHLILLFFRYQ